MKYRNFSEEMQEKDLKEVLEIIYPDTIFCGYAYSAKTEHSLRMSGALFR